MKELSIRNLEKGELELFKTLRLQALQDAPYAFDQSYEEASGRDSSYWARLFDGLIPSSGNIMLIAEKKDDVVGFIYGFNRGRNTGSFGGMWVNPTYRKQGIASYLIESIVSWAKETGMVELKIWNFKTNNSAQQLYEKKGFKKTGEEKRLQNGKVIVRLSKDILLDTFIKAGPVSKPKI